MKLQTSPSAHSNFKSVKKNLSLEGKLPFALANNPEAIKTQDPDAPGYPEKDTLFPFGFGLEY